MWIESVYGNFVMNPENLNEIFAGNGSRIFKQDVIDSFNCQPGEEICHRIPFKTMKNIMMYAVNLERRKKAETFKILENLRDVVMIEKVWDEESGCIVALKDEETVKLANEYINAINDNWRPFNEEQAKHLVDALDSFLMELNNAKANLRVGRACWNHSIGNAFDPFEKPALAEVEGKLSFILGWVDGFILQMIEGGCLPVAQGEELSIYTGTDRDSGTSFVYSSLNEEEAFRPVGYVDECKIPIWYPCYDLLKWSYTHLNPFGGKVTLPPENGEE